MYGNFGIHILQIVMWNESLEYALRLLTLLYKLNVTGIQGIRVPYETFHLPELSEYVDIRHDYLKWLTESDQSYVCNPGFFLVSYLIHIHMYMCMYLFIYILN